MFTHSPVRAKLERAFTLAELLVVIVIITILATLLLPGLTRAKGFATATACKNNLHQIGIGLSVYVNEFNKYPLIAFSESSSPVFWYETLRPYTGGSKRVFCCPQLNMPSDWDRWSTYALNNGGLSGSLGLGFLSSEAREVPVPETSVLLPSDMIAIGDGCPYGVIAGFGWPGCAGHSYQPHAQVVAAIFCDGHVEAGNPNRIPKTSSNDSFKPDETHAIRWFRDHQPHPELWPPN